MASHCTAPTPPVAAAAAAAAPAAAAAAVAAELRVICAPGDALPKTHERRLHLSVQQSLNGWSV